MAENVTHTLHWVQGNTVHFAIPLQQEIQTPNGKVVQDYYPSADDIVNVFMCGKYLSTQIDCTVNGNVVIANDNGNLKTGVYGVEIRIAKSDGTNLRSMWNYQVEIHKTNDGVLTEWNDFVAPDSQSLDSAIFFFAKGDNGDKGDKGDTGERGEKGEKGDKGDTGDTGVGVPAGGSTGQVLVKKSNTDYDTEWQDAPASGVSSVNGKSGAVTLGAEDVGALPAATPIPDAQVQSDWNEQDNTKVDYIKNKPTIPTVPTNVSSFNNDAEYITKSVDDLVNYYLKSEVYTKTEVANLIAAIQQFHYEIYASISAVTTPAGNVLYLIGPTGTGADKYEEYVYDSTKQEPWVKIGDTSIDLSGYYTSQQTDSAISQALNTALADYTTTANLTTLLAGKQDALTFETAPSSSNKVATMADMPTTMGASGSGHKGGLVPDTPSTAGTTKFLREDGQWEAPPVAPVTSVNGQTGAVVLSIPDVSNKEDRTAIVATSTASGVLNTEVGKYYRIDTAVGNMAIILPAMTDLTIARTVVIYLTAGTTPAVTIATADSKDVYYQDGFEIKAGKTYEVNALFNGAAWVIASVEIVVPIEDGQGGGSN